MSKKCILCESKSIKKILNFKKHPMFWQRVLNSTEIKKDKWINFQIVECTKCSLVQAKYEKKKSNYYDDEYFCSTWKENRDYQKKLVKNIINEYNLKNKKTIEIWCWDWFFSKELSRRGVDVYAIEPSGKAYKQAKKIFQFKI